MIIPQRGVEGRVVEGWWVGGDNAALCLYLFIAAAFSFFRFMAQFSRDTKGHSFFPRGQIAINNISSRRTPAPFCIPERCHPSP